MFFHSSLQPLPRLNISVRDLQKSQRSASVQSLLSAGLFCTTNSRRVLARERWQTFENSWEKNTIFNEHPVSGYMVSFFIQIFYPPLSLLSSSFFPHGPLSLSCSRAALIVCEQGLKDKIMSPFTSLLNTLLSCIALQEIFKFIIAI